MLNWNQTLMKWSLDYSLSELYPATTPTNKDDSHSRTLFNIRPYGKFIAKSSCPEVLSQLEPNFGQMVLGDIGPFQNHIKRPDPPTKKAALVEICFAWVILQKVGI